VLFALCALVKRFVLGGDTAKEPEGDSQARSWSQTATNRLLLSNKISVDNVITAILLAKHAVCSGNYSQAFSLTAVANRQAVALGLHKELSVSDGTAWTEREARRRIMFSCYCLDRMTASGQQELTSCPAESVQIQSPCEEYNFQLAVSTSAEVANLEGLDGASGDSRSQHQVGIMGHNVRIVGMRYVTLR
jgi:hypothetical protein